MKKKILALLLGAAMVVQLCACGSSDSKSDNSAGTQPETNEEVLQDTADETENIEDRELITLSMIVITQGNNTQEVQKVEDAINEILIAKYNTQIEYVEMPIADHGEKVNLKLATQESCDIFQGFGNYATFVDNGYMLELNDYMDYFDGALEFVGDMIEGSTRDGKIYSMPQYGTVPGDYCMMLRQDILDEIGVDINTVKNWDDFGDVLQKIKDAHPEMTPLMAGNNNLTPIDFPGDMNKGTWFDKLGMRIYVGVIMDPLNDTTVENYYATDSFRKLCNYAYEWAQKGLVDMDDVSDNYNLVAAGRSAGYANSYDPTQEGVSTQRCGTPMVAWKTNPNSVLTRSTNNTGDWCISAYCEYPERACEVLNEFYVNPEITNLLAWGIEGEDFVFENKENGVINYPEGLDSSSVPYYMQFQFVPNQALLYRINDGTIDTTRSGLEIIQEFNSTARNSLAYGFRLDTSNISTEIAACQNVVSEYYDALVSGKMDPSTAIDEFNAKLEAAGINNIIAEEQAQLDAWLASK